MKKTKSIFILSKLSNKDLKKLECFFESPFFHKHSSSVKLFHVLKKYHPHYRKLPSQEEVYARLFDKPFDIKTWHLAMSRFYKSIEDFLAHVSLDKQNITKEQLILLELERYSNPAIVGEKIKQLKKVFDKTSDNASIRFFAKIQLEEFAFDYYSRLQKPESITNLQNLTDYIDDHFLYLRLKYSCELITRENILAQKFDLGAINDVLSYAKKKDNTGHISVHIYSNLVSLVKDQNEEDYRTIRKMIYDNLSEISPRDLRDMNVFLINYCIRMSNLGKSHYLKELFSLYKDLLEYGIIIEGSYLHLYDFKNIATVATLLKEFDWLVQFNEQYLPYIKHEFRESASAFNLARIAFYNQDYRKALNLLLHVQYADMYYELGGRSIILKIYYEMDDFQLFEANCNSFKMFLSRTKSISDYQKKIHMNFIKWSVRLFKLKEKGKKISKKFQGQIEETNELADRTWIEEKVLELTP
ncbi:MAG: hypothetical protein MRY83_13555 [Flavobacteriales bacterium]|nr:hypothetical protein [Flavobacteriales bacterium]